MTNQEAFDAVYDHFVTKKQLQAIELTYSEGNKFRSCSYRHPNGARCAVGVLIPDNLYQSSFETRNIWSILNGDRDLRDYLHGVDEELLRRMQTAHDDADDEDFLTDIQWSLEQIARDFDLTVPQAS